MTGILVNLKHGRIQRCPKYHKPKIHIIACWFLTNLDKFFIIKCKKNFKLFIIRSSTSSFKKRSLYFMNIASALLHEQIAAKMTFRLNQLKKLTMWQLPWTVHVFHMNNLNLIIHLSVRKKVCKEIPSHLQKIFEVSLLSSSCCHIKKRKEK